MRVDAHHHFWRYNPSRDTWITDRMSVLKRDFLPSDLRPELERNGVDATVAVQADQSESETRFLLDLAESHGFISGVVGWIDLRSPDIAQRLESFSRFDKLVGFRHIVQAERDDCFLLQNDFVRGLRQLQSHGYTYDLLVYPRQLPAAVELAARLPEQAFVLDHIGKPEIGNGHRGGWKQQIRELAGHPNVYCKVSGIVTEADWKNWTPELCKPYLDIVFEAFGPQRLMFGSDWPVCLLAGTYEQVTNLVSDYIRQCSPDDEEAIMGGNATRFYRIKTPAWTSN